jgi:hypothetical protein
MPQKASKLFGSLIYVRSRSQVSLLSRDTDRAVVCVADSSGDAADSLHC